jgi:hypothetical protein
MAKYLGEDRPSNNTRPDSEKNKIPSDMGALQNETAAKIMERMNKGNFSYRDLPGKDTYKPNGK